MSVDWELSFIPFDSSIFAFLFQLKLQLLIHPSHNPKKGSLNALLFHSLTMPRGHREIHSLWNWTNEKSDKWRKSDIPTNHDSYGSNLYPIEKKYVDSTQTLNGHMLSFITGERKKGWKRIQTFFKIETL